MNKPAMDRPGILSQPLADREPMSENFQSSTTNLVSTELHPFKRIASVTFSDNTCFDSPEDQVCSNGTSRASISESVDSHEHEFQQQNIQRYELH